MKVVRAVVTWLRVTRAHFLGASLFPYAAAVAIASSRVRELPWDRVVLGGIAVALVHLGANLWNDYWDERLEADVGTHRPTLWSGGSRPTVCGLITPGQALGGSLLLLLSASVLGLYLDFTSSGHVIFWSGVLGLGLALAYSAPPARLAWRGWGEVVVGVAFGPALMAGASWLIAQRLSPAIVWGGAAVGLQTALVLLVNEFPDRAGDRRAGKRTLVVRLGPRGAGHLAVLLWALAYGSVGVGVWTGAFPAKALVVWVTAPLAGAIALMLRGWQQAEPQQGRALPSTLQVLLAALFTLGLGWACGTAGLARP
jgi:1,4-dihydroxy-2-naphthoate octaprenyltransferase